MSDNNLKVYMIALEPHKLGNKPGYVRKHNPVFDTHFEFTNNFSGVNVFKDFYDASDFIKNNEWEHYVPKIIVGVVCFSHYKNNELDY